MLDTGGTQAVERAEGSAPVSGASVERKSVRNSRTRLSVGKKISFSIFTTLLLFAVAELALWVAGVRPYRDTRDPVLDFAPGPPLFTRTGDEYRTTELRLTYFNPQRFAAVKPEGTIRVFCLGGSTTFGHPYDDRTSYVGWMREILNDVDGERKWEVVNCGGVSYASYRLARIMDELTAYEPDIFIIYTGQNEFLEERTHGHLRDSGLAALITSSVARMRTSTVVDSLLSPKRDVPRGEPSLMPDEVDAILDHTAGPATYERDRKRAEEVVAHYRFNLARMCRNAKAMGAHVILVKPASNLRDFSPFKSEHGIQEFGTRFRLDLELAKGKELLESGRMPEALAILEKVCEQDPQWAQAAYLAGTAAFGAGKFERADRYFRIACDEDVCPLRATTGILQAVDDVGKQENVTVVDFPLMLARRAQHATGGPTPGAESFVDHVHPAVEVHLELAVELIRRLASDGALKIGRSLSDAAETAYERVTSTINQTDHALALANLSQVLSWAGRDEEALRLAIQASEKAQGNVEVLAQLGRMYDKTRQLDLARKVYEDALQIEPENPLVLYRQGRVLMLQGSPLEACELLERAYARTPVRAPRAHRIRLLEALARCYEQLDQSALAADMLQRARSQ